MDVLRKAKKNAKKINTYNPSRNITNLLSSSTNQNGYAKYLQALEQYPLYVANHIFSVQPRSHIVFSSHLRSVTICAML